MNKTLICNFPNCDIKTAHWHCNVQGCNHIFEYRLIHEVGCYGECDGDRYGGYTNCCTGGYDILYHSHCSFQGCERTNMHSHCNIRNNCNLLEQHCHCSDITCNWTYNLGGNQYLPEIFHCHHPGCTLVYNHMHCQSLNCSNLNIHSHCDICNTCVLPYIYHEHCKHIDSNKNICNITEKHDHCEFCNITILQGMSHSMCLECGKCIIDYDHCHCPQCGITVKKGEQHFHCPYCDKLTQHYHCKYVTTHGCFVEGHHRHCTKCGEVKENGKKHICRPDLNKICAKCGNKLIENGRKHICTKQKTKII